MEMIIGVIVIAIIAYLLVFRKKPEVVQQVVEEVKAEAVKIEQKTEAVVAKVEEEVKAEVKAVATTATKAKAKAKTIAVEGAGAVEVAVKKVTKPRKPKAKPPVL